MANSVKNKGPIIETALCRCCRSIKRCRLLTSEYIWMGQKETYIDMIFDCFGIIISNLEDDEKDAGVCATCVLRLRDACAFKSQVLQSEQVFIETRFINQKDDEVNLEIKLEPHDVDNMECNDYTDDKDAVDFEAAIKDPPVNSTAERYTIEVELSGQSGQCDIKTNLVKEKKRSTRIKRRDKKHKEVTKDKDYQSDSDTKCSDNEDEEWVVKKKSKLCLDWNLVQKFDNCEEAETYIKSEGTWALRNCQGNKKYYRCNKMKRRGPQCSAKMYLLFEKDSYSVLLFKTNDHDHDAKSEFASNYGLNALNEALKIEIDRLFDLKMKPKAIMHCLTKMEGIQVPKMSQLRSYLNDRRRAVHAQTAVSFEALKAWIRSHSSLPSDPHEVFVISHHINDTDESNPTFRLVISTKYLIEISKTANVVHADSTHKMIWQGFSVFACGTTDQNHKFHPLCLTVLSDDQKEDFKLMFQGLQDKIHEIFESSWNPKVLVCDPGESIKDAFLEVFEEDVVVRVCWTHAKRNIQASLESIKDKDLRDSIMNDVDSLHCITNENIFDAASDAFLQKYQNLTEFVTYFQTHWLGRNRNWFLGAAPNSPSTNNALESFTKVIKDSHILRERFPSSRFLEVTNEMVQQWSNKYITNPEDNYIANTPSLTIKHWIEAYQWAIKPVEVMKLYTDDKYDYYQIPAGHTDEVFDGHWESFDDFKKQNFSKWLVLLPMESGGWMAGKCDCPDFFNFYICKHVIGLAIRLQYVEPPIEAKITPPIGEKRKRGRPSKAKQALIVQKEY